jgi:hypothetical protein
MICEQLTSLLGFECSPLSESGDIALISTPFKFDDGDALPVFVEINNGKVRFFDDGATLRHFLGRGVKIENKKHTAFLTNAASKNGAAFTEAGEIEAWANAQEAGAAFAQFMGSMLALAAWEREQRGVDTDASAFVEEVAMALRAWKPKATITLDPMYEGISGRAYKLDFLVEGQAVVATGSHANSVSSLLHRLIDIRGRIATNGLDVLVVIDDRQDAEAAAREASIVQSVATVMPFTALERKARPASHAH